MNDKPDKRVIHVELVIPEGQVEEAMLELQRKLGEISCDRNLDISVSPAQNEARARSDVKVTRLQ